MFRSDGGGGGGEEDADSINVVISSRRSIRQPEGRKTTYPQLGQAQRQQSTAAPPPDAAKVTLLHWHPATPDAPLPQKHMRERERE